MAGDPTVCLYSRDGNQWDTHYDPGGWFGGKIECNNTSQGYHVVLLKWLEHYHKSGDILMVSETMDTASVFKKMYPQWNWLTTDLYSTLNGGRPDFELDICVPVSHDFHNIFGGILAQGTLEHVYDPVGVMRNLHNMAKVGGVIIVHTHTPPFVYHPYPRDYYRFHIDWFEDMRRFVPGMELVEIVAYAGVVCAAYIKAE